jgi:hypothetical protein
VLRLLLITLIVLAMTAFHEELLRALQNIVVRKLSGQDFSGASRQATHDAAVGLWYAGTTFTRLVGIGFGFVRSPDLFGTLLVNTGVLGVASWIVLYAYPAMKAVLSGMRLDWIVLMPVVLIGLMMVAVPEYAYLPPWAFLGMAYWHVGRRSIVAGAPQRSATRFSEGSQAGVPGPTA